VVIDPYAGILKSIWIEERMNVLNGIKMAKMKNGSEAAQINRKMG
jgi:hypothetical protein